jgi:hypothetical protein
MKRKENTKIDVTRKSTVWNLKISEKDFIKKVVFEGVNYVCFWD